MAADLHWQVATTLEQLGGSFRVEYEAEDYSVDIALEDERIAIEVCIFTSQTVKILFSSGRYFSRL